MDHHQGAQALARHGGFARGCQEVESNGRSGSILLKTYGRPVCKGFCRDRRLISLLQRIRPRRSPPGQDGDTRAPVLINSSASCAVFKIRLPGRRLTVRPSRCHLSQTSLARPALSLRPNLYAATDTALASNGFPRCSTAQAILASLLAKATTATLRWVLRISSFAHRPSGVSRSAIWGSAARAP